jgi:hypothetical protein
MLDPQKTLEREAMLKRIRELEAEIAQHERNLREGEARLPQGVVTAVSSALDRDYPLAGRHRKRIALTPDKNSENSLLLDDYVTNRNSIRNPIRKLEYHHYDPTALLLWYQSRCSGCTIFLP